MEWFILISPCLITSDVLNIHFPDKVEEQGFALTEGRRTKPEDKAATPGIVEKDKTGPSGQNSGCFRRLALLGLVLLGLTGLIVDFPSSIGRDELSEGRNKLKALEQILRVEGFSDLEVEEYDGQAMIYGLVSTEAEANKVRRLAARQPYPIQVVVGEQEKFSRTIQSVLAGYGLFPQVSIENGEVMLLGYVLDRLTENAALSWARSAEPPAAPIRSGLLTRGAVEDTLAAELNKAGLTEKIVVDWRPGLIALSGESVDKHVLGEVMEAVRGALGSPLAFQLTATSEPERIYVGTADGTAGPEVSPGRNHAWGPDIHGGPFGKNFSLRSVTPARGDGAGLPFIVTSDGAVYFPGGTLSNGYTLTGIYADRLEFSLNGSTTAYKLQGR